MRAMMTAIFIFSFEMIGLIGRLIQTAMKTCSFEKRTLGVFAYLCVMER
jgi:hypothetical protein